MLKNTEQLERWFTQTRVSRLSRDTKLVKSTPRGGGYLPAGYKKDLYYFPPILGIP